MTERIRGVTGAERWDLFAEGPVVIFAWRNESGWPVEYVSPNVDRLFGYSPGELYDADPPYAELVHDDDIDRVIREVRENSDGTTERLPGKSTHTLAPGTTVSVRTPGGGGYGPPADRSRDAIVRDVQAGVLSVGAARETYGDAVVAAAFAASGEPSDDA